MYRFFAAIRVGVNQAFDYFFINYGLRYDFRYVLRLDLYIAYSFGIDNNNRSLFTQAKET